MEVCIRVLNPPPDEDLIFGIDMIIQPMTGTAGKSIVYSHYNIIDAIVYSLQMDQIFLIGQFLLLVSQLSLQLGCPERPAFLSEFLMIQFVKMWNRFN